jgi:Uma2 family endonuclease
MPVGELVSLAEYLKTSYRPDCDFIDGEVHERNPGEFDHSSAQADIIVWLRSHYSSLAKRVLPEQRVQVKATRFRIPDVCILAEGAPRETITRTPPTLCVEILSKDDSMSDIMERIDDSFQMGVPVCWIVEPLHHRAWIATPGHLSEPADGILRAAGFEVPLSEIFEAQQ